jgi:hypothetical protein
MQASVRPLRPRATPHHSTLRWCPPQTKSSPVRVGPCKYKSKTPLLNTLHAISCFHTNFLAASKISSSILVRLQARPLRPLNSHFVGTVSGTVIVNQQQPLHIRQQPLLYTTDCSIASPEIV